MHFFLADFIQIAGIPEIALAHDHFHTRMAICSECIDAVIWSTFGARAHGIIQVINSNIITGNSSKNSWKVQHVQY